MCAHRRTLRCLADLGVQESSVRITELGSVDCQGDPGFTASFPGSELSLRVGTSQIAFPLYKLNSRAA